MSRAGDRSRVFTVQRFDATSFSPNEETDSESEDGIRQASSGRAEVLACCCPINSKETAFRSRVPVVHLKVGTLRWKVLSRFFDGVCHVAQLGVFARRNTPCPISVQIAMSRYHLFLCFRQLLGFFCQ